MNGTAEHQVRRRRPRGVVLTALCLVIASSIGTLSTAGPAAAATVTAPGPIQIGDNVTGQLAQPGSQDQYSLLVKAPGASIALQITDNTCDCSFALSGRVGTVISVHVIPRPHDELGGMMPRTKARTGATPVAAGARK